MTVIAINGSPRKEGNTSIALSLMAGELRQQEIETEIIQVGNQHIAGCRGCGYCGSSEKNRCVITDDILNETAMKMRDADGFILASPTYYAGISGTMKCFLDRLFYANSRYFKYKVGTSISIARRAGTVDVIHQMNNYLQLAEMVIPPSQYWPVLYGAKSGEILRDEEGVQTIRKNAGAMAWLLKVIDASRGSIPLPPEQSREWTNFIR
ncbi:MAG: flavodoxin family protein [Spirochaetaceae bacterium]|jgi:multimeric flavodoxin WrbA|nr:flavodoxin family protein [Spirochaetaceae bacterium]